MKQLSRYVSMSVLSSMLLILFLLVGLDVVFNFIGELQGLKGNYRAPQALWYTIMNEPGNVYTLLPIAALVGGIVGLGNLATHSELTVMRAAGVSIRRIVWWVIRPALVLVVLGVVLGQFVVPGSVQSAELFKALAVGRAAPNQVWGFWHREGDEFIQIDLVRPDGILMGVHQYGFSSGPDRHLIQTNYADKASYQAGGTWQLESVHDTVIAPDGGAQSGGAEHRAWTNTLTPDFLQLATVDPEFLSLTSLYSFAHHLSVQGLDAGQYFLEFWKKVFAPLATISMVLIACSFIFGPLRSVTMGLRIVTGVMAGLLFRYGQDFFGYASLVYHFSPVVAAGLPIAFCLIIGTVAIARVR